jgi:hypothetical protein
MRRGSIRVGIANAVWPYASTAVLLQEDDATLQRRVCENDKTVKTYASAADWLARESAYLRKIARLLDTAGSRLSVVLTRCDGSAARP